MATVDKTIAEKIAANKGRYMDDTPAYAVFEYNNLMFGKVCYAVVYSYPELRRYLEQPHVDITKVMYTQECL